MGLRSAGAAAPDIAALTANGYLVASIDDRLAPKNRYPAPLEDLEKALEFLAYNADRFGIDPERIGLLGTSAGAHLALLYAFSGSTYPLMGSGSERPMVANGYKVCAVVDMFGPTDLYELFRGVQNSVAESVFGAHSLDDPVITEASPVCRISPQAPPILVIHGERDKWYPIHNR